MANFCQQVLKPLGSYTRVFTVPQMQSKYNTHIRQHVRDNVKNKNTLFVAKVYLKQGRD